MEQIPEKLRYTAWASAPHRPDVIVYVGFSGIQVFPLPWSRNSNQLPADVTYEQFRHNVERGWLRQTHLHHISAGIVYEVDCDRRGNGWWGPTQNFDPKKLRLSSPREAIALRMSLYNGCAPCVLSQLRWVYKLSDAQNEYEAARLVGHRPSKGTFQLDMLAGLLQTGFEVIEVGAWNHRQFLEEGLAYSRRYFGRRLWKSVGPHFTRNHAAIDQLVRSRSAFLDHLEEPSSRYSQVSRDASVSDVTYYLKQGYSVILVVDFDETGAMHTVLVLGTYEKTRFVVYNPSIDKPCLELWSVRAMASRWKPRIESLFAVRPS